MRRLILPSCLALAAALLAGCDDCVRCEKEQDRVLTELGPPEETESRRDGHFITETWFYWEASRSVVFLWDDRECSCSVNHYEIEADGAARPALRFETTSGAPYRQLAPE
jgi:hypothetical protein